MIASIPWLKSAFNFFMTLLAIYYPVYELLHPLTCFCFLSLCCFLSCIAFKRTCSWYVLAVSNVTANKIPLPAFSRDCKIRTMEQDTHRLLFSKPQYNEHIHASSRLSGKEISRCPSKQESSYRAAGNCPLNTLMDHMNQLQFLNLNSLNIHFNIIL